MLEWLGFVKPKDEEWQEPKGELVIRPMTYSDLDEVARLEKMCFGLGAWSRGAFASELKRGQRSCFMVARIGGVLVGFAGWRQEGDEAHVANIAVHPNMRGRKIGELLLRTILEEAVRRGLNTSLLEVRKSNLIAQNLYRKYGYKVLTIRRAYYQFPLEDAVVMKLEDIRAALASVPPPPTNARIVSSVIE
ncbi:MAG: ribosomal protein S18-alanine N-acetyltransferase [Armatimonadetes bacterium]|nr:ribosomal protein S18-alanine N-acetyltransferase [Armatimonadota bacterium]MCX7969257.1 ribosomal protein S18-alanine N-acetyltransferase [Armatimonadota bacterium]MDW8144108.1 ribosomal protein S18-alanine N-acetyltransferase [Armatimonadota bacterium]